MSLILDVLSWGFLLTGSFFVLVGGVGLLRFPDFFTRLHAVGVTDTLGSWLMLAGLMLQSGLSQTTLKLALIGVIFLFTSPTGSHALAKAALHGGARPITDGEFDHRNSD